MMDASELEKIIVENESLVIAILYRRACEEWAAAHLEVAKVDADIKVIEGKMLELQTIIHGRRKEISRTESSVPVDTPTPG